VTAVRVPERRSSHVGSDGGFLDVGCATIQLRWDSAPSLRAALVVEQRMAAFRAPCAWEGAPNLVLTLRAGDEHWLPHDDPAGAHAPVATLNEDGRWHAEWCYYRYTHDARGAYCEFADREAGLEHALRAAAVFGLMPQSALFFHAATLVHDGEAILFAGSPNAGKSTIAREGGADAVLSNEISILTRRSGRWWAVPSPYWGTGDTAHHAGQAYPLRALAVLEQAAVATSWDRLDGAHALAALGPHVGVQASAQWNHGLLSALQDLTMDLPVYRMAWRRGSSPFMELPWKP
jgi:hypothetical protein